MYLNMDTILNMEDQQGAWDMPTEKELLKILSSKYEFLSNGTPHVAKQEGL